MRKEKKFVASEYAANPLYRKMKERFSVEGQVTIGDFMRSRARRDGYSVPGYETPAPTVAAVTVPQKLPVVPTISPATDNNHVRVSKKSKPSFFKRHMTFFACFALFLCIALTLSVIIPVWTNFSASAGSDGIADTSDGAAYQPDVAPTIVQEETQPTFENVMNVFAD